MNLRSASFALLLPLSAVALIPAQKLVFSPEQESSHQKTFSTKASFQSGDSMVTVSVEPDPFPLDLEITWMRETSITDTYQEVAEGRPIRFQREFEGIAYEGDSTLAIDDPDEPENFEETPAGSSSLEGKTITFTWDPDGESYSLASEDADVDAEVLAGVHEAMDFRGLLPDSDVSPGDSWEPESEALVSYLKPGGDLSLVVESSSGSWKPIAAGIEPWLVTDTSMILSGETSVEAKCSLTEIEKRDGEDLAVIAIEVELESSYDPTSVMEERAERIGEELPGRLTVAEALLTYAAEGKGTLIWNTTTGLPHSFELTLDAEITMERVASIEAGGQEVLIESSLVLEGSITHQME